MNTQAKEGVITSGGFCLHYLQWGSEGSPLVMLHSMGMDGHAYDAFSRAIAEEHRVLAIDLLDHGDSDKLTQPIGLQAHAEVIRRVYTQLGFVPNVLIGHSVGGMLGMVLAAERPDEVKGLVLVDIAPFDPTRRRRGPPPTPPESFANTNEARTYLSQRFPKFTEEAVENRMKYAFLRNSDGSLRFKGTGETLRRGGRVDVWPFVERIRTSTLLLAAEDSWIVTPDTVERMRSVIPDFTVVTVKGASHMIPQDKPAEFEHAIRSFLTHIREKE